MLNDLTWLKTKLIEMTPNNSLKLLNLSTSKLVLSCLNITITLTIA